MSCLYMSCAFLFRRRRTYRLSLECVEAVKDSPLRLGAWGMLVKQWRWRRTHHDDEMEVGPIRFHSASSAQTGNSERRGGAALVRDS